LNKNLKNQFKKIETGSHLALLYKKREEWATAVSEFIAASIENEEKIIYVSGEYSDEFIKNILKDNNIDIDKLIQRGQLLIYTREQIYENVFNVNNILELLKKQAEIAIEEGYNSFNITGEISWVLKQNKSFAKIIDYEKQVEEKIFQKYPVKALCRYNMKIFEESLVKKIIELHPFLVWDNQLFENPYYIPSESFDGKNIYKVELEEWLNNIKDYQEEKNNYFTTIKEEENKFKFMFNKIDDPLFVHGVSEDGFTNFEMVNQSACEHLNYSEEELLSISPKDIDSDQNGDEYYKDKLDKLLNKRHVVFESEHVTKNGKSIPVENKSHLFEYKGETKVLTIARDISTRKKKEKIQNELLEEKSKFEFIFNEIEDALFVQGISEDAYTEFKLVNKKACRLLGYKRAELLDKRPIDIISQDSIEELKEGNLRQKLLEGKKIKFNVNMVTKSGNKIPVESKSHLFEYKGEKLVLTVTRDLRERIKKEKELSNQYEEIKEKNKRLKVLNNRMHKLLSTITDLSKYSIEDEYKFLTSLFRTAFEIIPKADHGSVYIYEDDIVHYLDTIGHDIEKLNAAQIPVDHFKKFSQVIREKNINEDLKERVSKEKVDIFNQGTVPIKETLAFDIEGNEEYIGGISLDIKKGSAKKFDDITLNIFSAFKDMAESFYKIQNYDKLRGEFTKELALSLIRMLEFHDKYTIGHSENVAILASDFAEYLNLEEDMVSRIYWAGLVHDIGKIIIPSYILNKEDKLTQQEYEIVKNHPEWAYETLKRSNQLSDIAKYVLYHHESWDGKGYPTGLKGNSIPYISQILSITDCWDAMRSNRAYRDALSYNEALKELQESKGKQHSAKLVDQFIKMINSEQDKLFSHK